jgi:hypothetical protein
MAVFQATTNIHSKSSVATAELLRKNLTEYGLVRILAREDIAPELVRTVPVDEVARAVQRSMRPLGPPGSFGNPIKAKKAKKAKKALFSKPPKAMSKKGYARPATAVKGRAVVRQVQPRYWARVTAELHILICTNDKKYASLRRQLNKHGSATQTAIVSNVAAALAVSLGFTVGALVPFVAMGLLGLIRVGTNAWCAGRTA